MSIETPDQVGSGLISIARQREASRRLAAELRALALDMLGLYDSEELSPEGAAWLRSTIEEAVARICDPAVSTIARQLSSQLPAAPPGTAHRIDQARHRHDAGFG